jgi:HK97 family phage prohead protease
VEYGRAQDRFPAEDGRELWSVEGREDGPPALEGWAVTYSDEPNFSGRIVVPGAFHDSLRRRPTKQKPLPMGYEHSTFSGTNPIGSWGAARDDPDRGVFLSEGRISDTAAGRDVMTLIRDRVLNGLSVGFMTKDAELGNPGQTLDFKTRFGTRSYTVREDGQPVVFVTQGELIETSIVSAPADDEARLRQLQSLTAQAARALPGLNEDADWEQLAYSMALLMGGRGAGREAFAELPDLERVALYQQLCVGYRRLQKNPPEYDPHPDFHDVVFHHDERELFAQRYVAKTLATVAAGLRGLPSGPLSREGCAMLTQVAREALPHLPGTLPPEAHELRQQYERQLRPTDDQALAQELRELKELLTRS